VAAAGVRPPRGRAGRQHRFAQVGTDLQDLSGVRPRTVVQATGLQDTYFEGGSAAAVNGRLASRPDGVPVSAETARDLRLRLGLRLRLVAAGGLAAGAAIGWALAVMLVAVLSGVFDPPPAALAVLWGYLAAAGGLTALALAAAGTAAVLRMRRPAVTHLRDL
jgi:hypothetical protein